jgi:hypothetical protein
MSFQRQCRPTIRSSTMKSAVPAVTAALPEARRMAVSEATGIPGDPLFAFHAANRPTGSAL